MKRKINKKWLIVIFLITFIIVVGVTFAFMFKKSVLVANNFTPAKVSCEVSEMFDGTNKTSIKVKNTSNISAYLRVSLVSYWVDKDGKIVGKPSEMPIVSYDQSNWIKSGNEEVYYYVSSVDAPTSNSNSYTTNLITTDIVLSTDTYNGETVYQVVEVFAEAIQSEPVKAAAEAWGVTIVDGKITAVN